MCVFDITPESDFDVIKKKALSETKQFLLRKGRALDSEKFTHKWVDWNPGGFFKTKQITSSDIVLRSIFGQDKIYRVSRLSLFWNSKDNIVDIMVLDPKYPVIIEYLDCLDEESFKYFRFTTKSSRSKIIFMRRHWKTSIDLPCKNKKVTYILDCDL